MRTETKQIHCHCQSGWWLRRVGDATWIKCVAHGKWYNVYEHIRCWCHVIGCTESERMLRERQTRKNIFKWILWIIIVIVRLESRHRSGANTKERYKSWHFVDTGPRNNRTERNQTETNVESLKVDACCWGFFHTGPECSEWLLFMFFLDFIH